MNINRFGGMTLAIACMSMGVASFGEEAKKDDAKIIAEQIATYPLKTCVVSGDKLGGDMGAPVDHVYQGRLVRFCCKGCIKNFNAEPGKFLKLIDDAAAKAKADNAAPRDATSSGAVKGQSGQGAHGGGCCGK